MLEMFTFIAELGIDMHENLMLSGSGTQADLIIFRSIHLMTSIFLYVDAFCIYKILLRPSSFFFILLLIRIRNSNNTNSREGDILCAMIHSYLNPSVPSHTEKTDEMV